MSDYILITSELRNDERITLHRYETMRPATLVNHVHQVFCLTYQKIGCLWLSIYWAASHRLQQLRGDCRCGGDERLLKSESRYRTWTVWTSCKAIMKNFDTINSQMVILVKFEILIMWDTYTSIVVLTQKSQGQKIFVIKLVLKNYRGKWHTTKS